MSGSSGFLRGLLDSLGPVDYQEALRRIDASDDPDKTLADWLAREKRSDLPPIPAGVSMSAQADRLDLLVEFGEWLDQQESLRVETGGDDRTHLDLATDFLIAKQEVGE